MTSSCQMGGILQKKGNLDNQEKIIVRELIRNPRISDNQIALKTNIPLKTVNRKRKLLEEQGILKYLCYVEQMKNGTNSFNARSLFIVTLRNGITRKGFTEKINISTLGPIFNKHTLLSFNAEIGANVAAVFVLESRLDTDMIEIFNAEIIPRWESVLGHGCVKEVQLIKLGKLTTLLHNYLIDINMEKGIIKESWPNENIFVCDTYVE